MLTIHRIFGRLTWAQILGSEWRYLFRPFPCVTKSFIRSSCSSSDRWLGLGGMTTGSRQKTTLEYFQSQPLMTSAWLLTAGPQNQCLQTHFHCSNTFSLFECPTNFRHTLDFGQPLIESYLDKLSSWNQGLMLKFLEKVKFLATLVALHLTPVSE